MIKEYHLYNHQQVILDQDKKKCGIFTGTGSGKTLVTLLLAKGNTLVICPKQQREDRTWQINAEKFKIDIKLTVISKEELRRDWQILPAYNTVICDEVHTCLGVLPEVRQRKGIQIPKTSQIFEALFLYINKIKPERIYLCSATPVVKPMGLWAISKLFDQNWDFFRFRDKYYSRIRIGQREVYIPNKSEAIKNKMIELIQNFGYTGQLTDFFDVPEQSHKTVKIDLSPQQITAMREMTLSEADPLVRRSRLRTIENGILYGKKVEELDGKVENLVDDTKIYPSHKIDYILERAIEFPKLLIFANYTAQINEIAKALRAEGYTVKTLTGQTKDRATLVIDAEKSKACIVIAQSSISSGYELPSFPCVIYASKSWQVVHYTQSLGRVLRGNALKKNLYIHLVVDGCDGDCHKAIMSGQDFQEKLSLNY